MKDDYNFDVGNVHIAEETSDVPILEQPQSHHEKINLERKLQDDPASKEDISNKLLKMHSDIEKRETAFALKLTSKVCT